MTTAPSRPLVVIALGGNALLQRTQSLDDATQRANARSAAESIAELAHHVDLVVTHGNGPQVGLLALQQQHPSWPLDILVAETQGMVGYVLASELDRALGTSIACCVITRVVVDPNDSAFDEPTKPIGPMYPSQVELQRAAAGREWASGPDGTGYRRLVASPSPLEILELELIRSMVTQGFIPVCCGGGGIPIARHALGEPSGVEAVIDKDATASLLAIELEADGLLLLTDVEGVYSAYGTPEQRLLTGIDVGTSDLTEYAAGSMRPKLAAAARFASQRNGTSIIGQLDDALAMWQGHAGTNVRSHAR
ncbi:MAG: carbamate kinase [Thermoleophilia bacterium]|nr:carbamate kinase [Thermoleophilia bacterium]